MIHQPGEEDTSDTVLPGFDEKILERTRQITNLRKNS